MISSTAIEYQLSFRRVVEVVASIISEVYLSNVLGKFATCLSKIHSARILAFNCSLMVRRGYLNIIPGSKYPDIRYLKHAVEFQIQGCWASQFVGCFLRTVTESPWLFHHMSSPADFEIFGNTYTARETTPRSLNVKASRTIGRTLITLIDDKLMCSRRIIMQVRQGQGTVVQVGSAVKIPRDPCLYIGKNIAKRKIPTGMLAIEHGVVQ